MLLYLGLRMLCYYTYLRLGKLLHLLFGALGDINRKLVGGLTTERFRAPIINILQIWGEWGIYPPQDLRRFYEGFMGTNQVSEIPEQDEGIPMTEEEYQSLIEEIRSVSL